ncbi:MAG: single-stranded-DNA-specific exonuclease RecJ [Lachnospiraceae bacterium]
MKINWRIYAKQADFDAIGEKYHIDKVIARIMRNRDIEGDEAIQKYLYGSRADLYDGMLMKDMEKGMNLLADRIARGKKIRIIGDYDIDGVSSTYILLRGLRELGGDVDYVIPHRVTDGYGINIHLVEEAGEEGVDTILTCDNGIAQIPQIARAKELGMTVIVTDHHDIHFVEDDQGNQRYILPPADAVINPKQEDCAYPFKKLCGAGVAYKLIECLYKNVAAGKLSVGNQVDSDALRQKMQGILNQLLEMVAVATIGDIMELCDENRILVKEGLALLNHTENLGLRALMEVNGLEVGHISSYHISFVLGPCLNASGRLESAKYSLELLLAKSSEEAGNLAEKIKMLNEERKNITEEQKQKAIEEVEHGPYEQDKVLVIYLPECHESVAGIIAGKVRERFYRPTIILTNGEHGIKGSGRSIECYNMFEHLLKVKDLMTQFGGHPMAAGVSLPAENLDEFRRRLNEDCDLTEEDLIPREWIDVAMPVDYITESLVEQLDLLEPFGNGNVKPVFADSNLIVRRVDLIGKNKNVLKLLLVNEQGRTVEALKFGVEEEEYHSITVGKRMKIVYYPSVNEYMGRKTLQVIIKNIVSVE